MTFFGEVLETFIEKHAAGILATYDSEMRDFPVYGVQYKNTDIALVQAPVGSASAAMMADFLIGHGARILLACGGCGVLEPIPAGDVLLPVCALRDEGASYHYLPPARDIKLDTEIIKHLENTLKTHSMPYMPCKVWTTDALYRETEDMVAYRREEGCSAVDTECAAFAAVARFRGAHFGQLLYSGDTLANVQNYDSRGWENNLTAREKLFMLTMEAAASCPSPAL